jgi:hypothetical protein
MRQMTERVLASGLGSLTHRKAHMAFTRNGEQYQDFSGSPRVISSKKQSTSMNEKRKVLSHVKNDDTKSETIPSPVTAVHGLAFNFTRLPAKASASIFSSRGSLIWFAPDPDAKEDQGSSNSASLMDLQTASGSSEFRMRERISWASGLGLWRRRPNNSLSRSFSSWSMSHFRFKANVRLTFASSTSYWHFALFATQRPHEGRFPSHCRLGQSFPVPTTPGINAPSPSSADNANKPPERAFSSVEAYGLDLMPRVVLSEKRQRPGAASGNAYGPVDVCPILVAHDPCETTALLGAPQSCRRHHCP